MVMFPALLISYVVSTMFSDSQYQGFTALAEFNFFRVSHCACQFAACAIGQLLDVVVFNRLRQLKTWWIAPTGSMTFGSMADTFFIFCYCVLCQ